MATILVVEDEEQICKALKNILTEAEHTVFIASDMKRGEIEAATRKPDLLVVDLGLPDGDGLTLIQNVRRYLSVPIIVLSARTSEESKIAALDAGADDYLTKPFGSGELLARVRAQLRRFGLLSEVKERKTTIHLGQVEIDLERFLLTKNGEPLHLTKLEFRLLQVLLSEHGKVLTQRFLLQRVWGPNYVEHQHYLRIYINRLRQKLEEDPTAPQYLLTETGVGYRLLLPAQD